MTVCMLHRRQTEFVGRHLQAEEVGPFYFVAGVRGECCGSKSSKFREEVP